MCIYLCQNRRNTPLHLLELLNKIIKFLCHLASVPILNFSFQFLNSCALCHGYCRLCQNKQDPIVVELQDLPISTLENKVSWNSLKIKIKFFTILGELFFKSQIRPLLIMNREGVRILKMVQQDFFPESINLRNEIS